jgi:drug/metabolite transporter (DMT)-like permease
VSVAPSPDGAADPGTTPRSSEPAPVPPAFALLAAVVAMSWAGPLVRFTDAPALAVAAWRLTLSLLIIAVILLLRRVPAPRLTAREWGIAVVGGIFLAAHFWAWIASLDFTTVSSSVVLVSMQPVFVALMSGLVLGEAATRRQWLGIVIAVAGAVAIAGGDLALGGDALFGDVLALLGAVFVSIYYVIGRRLRPGMDIWWYVALIYGVAAVVLLAAAVAMRVPLTGYHARDWSVFLALAAGPMIVGHTGINYALRYVRAYVANLAVLAEPVGATLIAWMLPAIAETPGPQTLVGGLLILGGIALTLTRREERGLGTRVVPSSHAGDADGHGS